MKYEVILTQPVHPKNDDIGYSGKEMPLGLAYLAAYLEKESISTRIVDLELYDNPHNFLKEALKESCPSVIGISAFTIDITFAHELARLIKEVNPNIRTVIGGLHASALPERTLEEHEFFDYLIYGEGLVTMTELVKAIRDLKSNEDDLCLSGIRGLVYRHNNTIKKNSPRDLIHDLDELPFPARDKLENEKYRPHIQKCKRLPSTGLVASMGCPYTCSYCSVQIVNKRVRYRSPENVVEEMKECVEKHGITDLRFFDDCITLNKPWLIKLCNLIIKEKLDVYWNCQGRVDGVTLDLLKLMKKARCHQITYGIETGNEKSLKAIEKGATLEQARNAIKWTKKAGLESGGSFILGLPGESVKDVRQTIRFAKELSPDIVTFYILKAYPGSKMYDEAVKEEKLKDVSWEDYLIQNPTNLKGNLSDEELKVLLKEAYYSFYLRSSFILQRAKKLLKEPIREMRIILEGLMMLNSYFKHPKKDNANKSFNHFIEGGADSRAT